MSEYIPLRRNNGQFGGRVLNASHQNIAKIKECKMKYLVTFKHCFPPMKMKETWHVVMAEERLSWIHVCAAFPLKCPEPAQWSLRASSHCPDSSKYFCLKNDLINGYSENCTVFDFLQPGRKHVLRGGLDADVCSSKRYQPWPINFYTNVSTKCIFVKSTCNEEGQVIYDKGNRNIDVTCRCDYTRGYDFIVKTLNPCFCVPSKEDCSCYLKKCTKSTDMLSPDYTCIRDDEKITVSECKPILYKRSRLAVNTSSTENISTTRILSYEAMFTSNIQIEHHCTEGDNIKLKCSVYTDNIEVKWYKENNELHECTHISITSNGNHRMLTIVETEVTDSGTYFVKAQSVVLEMSLTVKGNFVTKVLTLPH
ncbi:unnamed protein product [Mytilus edulis]|uniref:Ig-like domain-containing protein n=1 Tax=Mytilus edulis TaxID=6550 RepID=A0A8S3U319_MYTED|nr:unnamed protein product [Mytilus edulis]